MISGGAAGPFSLTYGAGTTFAGSDVTSPNSASRKLDGAVSAGVTIKNIDRSVADQLPAVLGATAAAVAVTTGGAAVLSRRLLRQTRGLGPAEITRMYEHHDAVLHAAREGVVIVDAEAMGFNLKPEEAHEIARLGVRITNAANKALGFDHPENPDWRHFSFCLFAGKVERTAEGLRAGAAVAIQPGKVDRSPTGTALSARMAVLHARGEMKEGETLTAVSLIGSTFTGRILGTTTVGDRPAILPEISGRGWITGIHQHMLDPSDPWPEGYRLTDTWGAR